MGTDPWTDPDPKPGAFDGDFATLDPRQLSATTGIPKPS